MDMTGLVLILLNSSVKKDFVTGGAERREYALAKCVQSQPSVRYGL